MKIIVIQIFTDKLNVSIPYVITLNTYTLFD